MVEPRRGVGIFLSGQWPSAESFAGPPRLVGDGGCDLKTGRACPFAAEDTDAPTYLQYIVPTDYDDAPDGAFNGILAEELALLAHRPFPSWRGEITLNAILASAAMPTLFRAVHEESAARSVIASATLRGERLI